MELREYWPRYLQGLLEFGQIADAEQPEVDRALQAVRAAPDDFFLESLSEYGCCRWEAILGISEAENSALEERRARIRAMWDTELPYTYRWLAKWLASICGGDNPLPTISGYTLRVSLPVAADYPWILDDLRQRIPANLVIAPTILLTQAASKRVVGSAVRLSIKQSMTGVALDDEMTAFTSDTGAVLTDEHDKILYVEEAP